MQIRIDLSTVAKRRLRVELEVERRTIAAGELQLMLPVWTPGSYLIREYARHLLALSACDAATGAPLELRKTHKNRYSVCATEGTRRVVVRYEVYANALTVREAAVGPEFAFWNGACIYLWPVGEEDAQAEIAVDLPDGWDLFCGAERQQRGSFHVAGLDEAVDTPCLAARSARLHAFEALQRPFRLVSVGLAGVEPPVSLIPDIIRVVECAADVFGRDVPIDSYTILGLFGSKGRGGLEHANSTTLLAPRTTFTPRRNYEEFVSLVAHEFFHVWNGKAMRPRDLARIDYERENYTRLLWVVEGFTAYYDDLLCLRAGIIDARGYLRIVTGHAENMLKMPGRLEQSLGESSLDAWVRFYRPDENTRNTTQNYYSNGALAALCLDARIREITDGARSLDDVMRWLWKRARPHGYTHEDVAAALSEIAAQDLTDELRSLVEQPFEPDLAAAFEVFGLDASWKADGELSLGLQFAAGELRVASVFDGTAAWEAGLAPDDEIIAIAGLRVAQDTWADVFAQVAAEGAELPVLIARRGRIEEHRVRPERRARSRLEVTPKPDASAQALRLRAAWLGPTGAAL